MLPDIPQRRGTGSKDAINSNSGKPCGGSVATMMRGSSLRKIGSQISSTGIIAKKKTN